MSSIVEIKNTVAIDPRLAFDITKSYVIEKGAQNISANPITASTSSNASTTFIVPVNNQHTVVDRFMMLSYTFNVTITAPDQGIKISTALGQNVFALRQLPITSCMTALSLQLAGESISIQPDKLKAALTKFQLSQNDAQEMSLTPILADQSQTYAQLFGSSKSPLNSYENSTFWAEGRGSHNKFFITGANDSNTQWDFTVNVIEPVFLSPMLLNPLNEAVGLSYINSFNVNILFGPYLSRMFSYDAVNGIALTNIAVSVQPLPQLEMRWLSLQPTQELPSAIPYGFEQIQTFDTQLGVALAPAANGPFSGGSATGILSTTVSFDSIPTMIWVWVNRPQSDYYAVNGYTLTDTAMAIDNISIDFNNRNNLMSRLTPEDLYRGCVRNGCKQTWTQWRCTQGSYMAISPVTDLGMDISQAPGSSGVKLNFQVRLNVHNLNPTDTITPTIYVAWAVSSTLVMAKSMIASVATNILSEAEVVDALSDPIAPIAPERNVSGGFSLDSIKNVLSKIHSGVKEGRLISKTLGQFQNPYAQTASAVAHSLGYGDRRRGRHTGTLNMPGGGRTSRKQLEDAYNGRR